MRDIYSTKTVLDENPDDASRLKNNRFTIHTVCRCRNTKAIFIVVAVPPHTRKNEFMLKFEILLLLKSASCCVVVERILYHCHVSTFAIYYISTHILLLLL